MANDNKASRVVILVAVAIPITTGLVCLRVYTRAWILRNFKQDDWALLVAWFLILSTCVSIAVNTSHGLGRHVDELDNIILVAYRKNAFALYAFYLLSIPAIKIAIILQYLRVFPIGYVQPVGKILLIFVSLWGLSQFITSIVQCTPIAKVWDPSLEGFCINGEACWLTGAAIHIVTDFIIFAMPLPVLWTLGVLAQPQKIALIGVFGLGFFTCAVSIIRFVYLAIALNSKDYTWTWTELGCWAVAELNCALACACAPTLTPLLRRLRDVMPPLLIRKFWKQSCQSIQLRVCATDLDDLEAHVPA
ncbi:hypothetical protein GGI35DRAFT_448898 [Trichoderma velutinum]